jgi:hypothetical protein
MQQYNGIVLNGGANFYSQANQNIKPLDGFSVKSQEESAKNYLSSLVPMVSSAATMLGNGAFLLLGGGSVFVEDEEYDVSNAVNEIKEAAPKVVTAIKDAAPKVMEAAASLAVVLAGGGNIYGQDDIEFQDAPLAVPAQDIEELQTELARSAFPVLGNGLPIVNRAWSFFKDVAVCAGYEAPKVKGLDTVASVNIKAVLDENKVKASDVLKNSEKLLQTAFKARVIDQKEQSITIAFKAIAKAVRSAFHAIGVFFGLCKAESKIVVQLEADKAALTDQVNAKITVLNQLYSLYSKKQSLFIDFEKSPVGSVEYNNLLQNLLRLNHEITKFQKLGGYEDLDNTKNPAQAIQMMDQIVSDIKQSHKDGMHELKRKAKEDLIREETTIKIEVLNNEYQAKINATPAGMEDLMAELSSLIIPLNNVCEAKVEELNKKSEIEKTDETVRNWIASEIDKTLSKIPAVKKIAAYVPAIINKIESILTSTVVDHVVKFAREYILGDKNQKKMMEVMNNVQDNLVANLTSNLKVINDVYMGHAEYTAGMKTYEKHMEIQNEIVNKLPLHRAVPQLTDIESTLLAKKRDLEKNGATVAERQAFGIKARADLLTVHTKKIADLNQGMLGLNPTKQALQVQLIADEKTAYNKALKSDIASEAQDIADLTNLKSIEDKIAKAESVYLNSISVLLLDYVIFPDGMPSDLQNLLRLTLQDPRQFALNAINKNLVMAVKHLDDPKALRKLLNTELTKLLPKADKGNDQAALIKNAKALMNTNLDNLQGNVSGVVRSIVSAIDAAGSLELVLNSLERSRVNKYMLFSALDKTVDGVVAAYGKQQTLTKDGMILIRG